MSSPISGPTDELLAIRKALPAPLGVSPILYMFYVCKRDKGACFMGFKRGKGVVVLPPCLASVCLFCLLINILLLHVLSTWLDLFPKISRPIYFALIR